MALVAPGHRDSNTDLNHAVRTLAPVAALLGIAGMIAIIAGFSAGKADSSGVVTGDDYAAIFIGSALTGSALSVWLILGVFWGWRFAGLKQRT